MRVCAQPTFIADYGVCIRGATIRFVKDGEYQKEVYWGATVSLHRFVKDG